MSNIVIYEQCILIYESYCDILNGHITTITDKVKRNINQALQLVSIVLTLNSFSLYPQTG